MTFPTFYDFVHFGDSLEIWAAAKAKKRFLSEILLIYISLSENVNEPWPSHFFCQNQ